MMVSAHLELDKAVIGAISRQEAQLLLPIVALVGGIRVSGCQSQQPRPRCIPRQLSIRRLQIDSMLFDGVVQQVLWLFYVS